uniref:Response regulatory domain-containing protein n=2 Tax=Brassica oleracea var. oleracea TaxID=109376 RepID=A0A0D3C6M3_BRAOL
MGEVVVLSSDEGTMETMMSRGKSSEVVRWEKYLPTTVLRVLLVESDDSTRQIITALLQKCSYKVVAVSDGLAAWETLKEKTHNIDLILTELDLPAISGFALLALVMEHEACKHIPVIMMSSQDSMTMVLKCMLRGAADYLIKPMRKNELKNLWQHVWRRLTLRGDHTANGPSLPASQQNVEDNDETCADSRYHSDHGSGSQAISDNGEDKLMADVKPVVESFDVTMDLIGGIDKRSECFYGDNTGEQHVGPELGLSLKRSCSGRSLEKNQDESKHQKISLSDASDFSRYENGKAGGEKAVVVAVEASSSAEPKTPSESHEKLLRCDHGSATTSSNHENIGSSSVSGQNQFLQSGKQESLFPVESNRLKASKEVEVGSQSTNEGTVTAGGQNRSSSTREKAKEEEEEGEGGGTAQQRKSEREAALMKFRMKKKDRCFGKKVRYESRKKLADQRPRVKGQFVRAVNSDAVTSQFSANLRKLGMASSSPQHCHIIEVNPGKSVEESTTTLASKACGEAPCGFSDLNNASGDAQERNASMRKLCIAVVLCLLFMTVEVFGGIKANSLAILTDAAHLLSDVAAFAISLFSLWAAGWEATPRQTYGFFRIEILGALVSIQLIWLLTGILVYEAIIRLLSETSEVNGFLMFLVAAFGLLVNIIMAVLLGHDHGHGHSHGHDHHSHGVTVTTHHHHHGHGEDKHHHAHGDEDVTEQLLEKSEKRKRNINVQGAYLHVLGDSIQSVGVMIGGGIIWYKPEWKIVDLICTLVFSVIVLGTTINMIRSILEVLMESTPREIDATKLEKGLLEMEEVVAVHELHIWAITVGKVLLACHVNIRPEADADMVLNKVIDYIRREYNISHVTIQIER